jgi:hypothetical protein
VVRGTAAHQPEQQDVPAEREQLEGGGGDDPGRVGVERAPERVGECLQRPAEDHDGEHQSGGSGSGQSGPARQRTEIGSSEREVLGGHVSSIGTAGTARIRDITSVRVRRAVPRGR